MNALSLRFSAVYCKQRAARESHIRLVAGRWARGRLTPGNFRACGTREVVSRASLGLFK